MRCNDLLDSKTLAVAGCTTHNTRWNIDLEAVMRRFPIFPFLLASAVAIVGCSSTSPPVAETSGEDAIVDTNVVHTMAIHVLVDGDDQGTIPRTLRIRRSFGTQQVSLWQAGEEIRIYEIEIVSSVAGDQLMQGFWSTPSSDGAAYEVKTLPKRGEYTYQIPYSRQPMRIDDNEYGLTLLVSD